MFISKRKKKNNKHFSSSVARYTYIYSYLCTAWCRYCLFAGVISRAHQVINIFVMLTHAVFVMSKCMCLCGTCLYSAFSESYASSHLTPTIPTYSARTPRKYLKFECSAVWSVSFRSYRVRCNRERLHLYSIHYNNSEDTNIANALFALEKYTSLLLQQHKTHKINSPTKVPTIRRHVPLPETFWYIQNSRLLNRSRSTNRF